MGLILLRTWGRPWRPHGTQRLPPGYGRAAPMPATWRKPSAAAGGEEQHEPGGPAVEYVEAGFVEEPFHFAAGIDA